jgi:hypothetical protein
MLTATQIEREQSERLERGRRYESLLRERDGLASQLARTVGPEAEDAKLLGQMLKLAGQLSDQALTAPKPSLVGWNVPSDMPIKGLLVELVLPGAIARSKERATKDAERRTAAERRLADVREALKEFETA